MLQRQNKPLFYIDKIKPITIQDFEDNNIYIIIEESFFSLYYLFPSIENHKEDFLFDLYLKDNKGIVIFNKDNNKYFYIFEVNNSDITQIKNCDLIDFFENGEAFNYLRNELKQYDRFNEIWNEIINLYSINCNYIMNNSKLDLNAKIEGIMNKVSQFKEYFKSNPNKNNKEIYLKKIEGFYYSLFSLEKMLKLKENMLYNNLKLLQSFNSNNNFNNNINNFYNSRDTNVIFDMSNLNQNQNNNNNQNNNINYINNNNNYRNILKNGKVNINKNNPSLGLANIGSTCYMNATIQCLAHLPEISEELIKIYLDKKNSDNFVNYIQTHKLTIEYTKLLIEVFFPQGDKISFPPYDFKQILGNQDSMFGSNEAEDAKDLYLLLIETMNNELNGGIPAVYNDILRLKIDPKDQKKIKETFMNEFNRKNNTPFSNYLYGFSQTCSICSHCQSKLYNFECFNVLSFPLLDVKNFISQNSINYNEYTLNLRDCFNYYLKTEFYNGDNKLYCQTCNSNQDSCLERVIDSTPKILVIILDRGLDNHDFTGNFIFDEFLDLSDLVSKDTITQYYLCGVITHFGESGPSGHFIAYCRMENYSDWYQYNDSQVSKINSQEIFNSGKPYILFYHYYG